jgi:hypothetical protein
MAEVIYKGDHAEVVVPLSTNVSVTAVWGEPVEMPDKVAASLLESKAWIRAGKKSAKKAGNASAETEVNDKKGATDGDR